MQPLCSSSVLLASLTPPLMSLLSSRGVTEQALWNEGVVGGEKRGTAPATLGASSGLSLYAQATTHKIFQATVSP